MCYNGYPGKPGYRYPDLSKQKRDYKKAHEGILIILKYIKSIIRRG